MNYRNWIWTLHFFSALLLLFFMGCSSGQDDSQAPGGVSSAASISIGVSGSSVKSDDSNSITVTASVLDNFNAAVEGATIQFSTSSGALSAATAITDESGSASVSFHSGMIDQSNRVATITAVLGGLTTQVPVQIVGTTVSVSQERTTLSASNASSNLEIYVTNAGGTGIYNTEAIISVDPASSGTVNLSPTTGFTGVDGTLDVTVTGVASGTVTLNIEAAGAMTSCSYSVETTGNILQITQPTTSPAALAIGDSLTITVSDPNRGTVVLSTTLGTLNGTASAVMLDASSGTVSATLTTDIAGTATIQAYNTDAPGVTDSISVVMFAPASAAAQISIQASSTVVALSTGGLTNSIELTARVTDAIGNPVGSAPVVFSMINTPGGGERLSPSIVFTDGAGNAVTTFTSGSLSTSGQGVTITAALLANSAINDSIEIIIGGTSGSVVIGESTSIYSINNDTAYQLPVSVLVSDSNGNPVPGAVVTINLWPRYYNVGDCVYGVFGEDVVPTGPCVAYDNEDDLFPGTDFYRNQFMDAGEDLNLDGELTPPNSSSGNMPQTIEVDDNGVGTFDWIYLKTYAGFIVAEIKASTEVLGSETTTTVLRTLRPSQDDVDDKVLSGVSPFIPPP